MFRSSRRLAATSDRMPSSFHVRFLVHFQMFQKLEPRRTLFARERSLLVVTQPMPFHFVLRFERFRTHVAHVQTGCRLVHDPMSVQLFVPIEFLAAHGTLKVGRFRVHGAMIRERGFARETFSAHLANEADVQVHVLFEVHVVRERHLAHLALVTFDAQMNHVVVHLELRHRAKLFPALLARKRFLARVNQIVVGERFR